MLASFFALIVFYAFQWNNKRNNVVHDITFKNQDESTQTDIYDCDESWTNQALDEMLARRLNNPSFS
ncbi:MAG: hypothetical protein ACKPKO_63870, partial [Candidatus Fonsibacter sp.]